MAPRELEALAGRGGLRELAGIGEVTERTIAESLRGEEPVYLRRMEATGGRMVADLGAELCAAHPGKEVRASLSCRALDGRTRDWGGYDMCQVPEQ